MSNKLAWALVFPAVVFIFLFLVFPVAKVFLFNGIDLSVWQDPYFLKKLQWTIFQAGFTSVLATVIGLPLAYLISQHNFPIKNLFLRLLLLPFVTPTLVAVLGISSIGGYNGLLSNMLGIKLHNSPLLLIWGNLFFNLPIIIRMSHSGFSRVSPKVMEAARSLGSSFSEVIWRIAIPLAFPSVAAGFLLVFLYSSLSFGLPLALGGERFSTLEVEIYLLTAQQLRLSEASALIAGQLLFTILITILYLYLSKYNYNTTVYELKNATGYIKLCIDIFLLIVFIICFSPLLAVIIRSFMSNGSFNFHAWVGIFTDENSWLWITNSLRFGLVSTSIACLLGVLYSLGANILRSKILDTLSLLPLMVSPISLAVGYLIAYPRLSASLVLLISAYTLMAFPLVARLLIPAIRSLPPKLTEAARTLGAQPWQVFFKVTLPLLLPSIRGGAALALTTVLGEFSATLVLSRPEWATLCTGMYERFGLAGEQNLREACAIATLLLLSSALSFAFLDSKNTDLN